MTYAGLGLLVVALALLPGLAGGVGLTALTKDVPRAPGTVLARSLTCALLSWLLAAGLLVRTVGISSTAVILTASALAVVSLVVLAAPRCREVMRQSRPDAAYLGAASALSLLAWAPLGLLVWGATEVGTFASTPWYYWGLARQVLASGRFPDSSVEFAERVPYLADYPLFSAGTATLMAPLPESAQPVVLALVVTLAVAVLGCAAGLLSRAWGASPVLSLVAAPLSVTVGIGAFRLLGYRPEGFALGPALLVVVLVVDWYRSRQKSSLVLAALLAGVVSQVHGIAFLAMVLLLVAATVTLLVTGPGRPMSLVLSAVVAAVTMLAAFAGLALAMGGFSGSGTSTGVAGINDVDDPTWAFRTLALGRDPTEAPTASRLLTASWEDLYEDRTTTVHWVVVGAVAVVLLAALLTARGRRREALQPLVFFVLAAGAVLGVGWLFVMAWDTYVPRRTGSQRLFLEATLVVPVFLAGAASALVALVGNRRARGGAAAALLALALGCGLVSALELREEAVDWRPSPQDQEALAAADVPDDAVVLANAYTEGYLSHVTGATALLEGRAPYTFPDQLDRSLQLLLDAKRFYADPTANREFLDRHGVDYVLYSRPGSFSASSANTFDDTAAPEELRAVPGMEEVVSSPGLVVFRYRPR